MNEKRVLDTTCALVLIKVFIQLPIWYYLLYTLLKASEADSLAWFLFWVYVPLGVFLSLVAGIATEVKEPKKC